METLILQTENNLATKEILKLIKKMKSVKFISVENTDKRITADNLALPGRPLTDDEIEEISELMDKEIEFKNSEDIFNDIINSIRK